MLDYTLKKTRFLVLLPVFVTCPVDAGPDLSNWQSVLHTAQGQTVYWHAWGGDPRINDYIDWVGEQVASQFRIHLRHVKLTDTAEAVSRVLAEKMAGREEGGAVDLLWINGENFTSMKENGLLYGPWAAQIPNWQHLDMTNPGILVDATVPTEGYELPWMRARLIFYYDSRRLDDPPRSTAGLLNWAGNHPGRFAYPQPPDFLGTTFLKQILHELVEDPSVLYTRPDATVFAAVTRPLWSYLDRLTPMLWRSGRAYPQNGAKLRQLMADGEIDLALSLNPGEVLSAIANYELPGSVRSYLFDNGTLSNTSYLAIPFNADAKAGAIVIANFLLSVTAQRYMQDPAVWGSLSVLDPRKLPAAKHAPFPSTAADNRAELSGKTLPELHPDWTTRLEAAWQRRYGVAR